MKLTAILKHVLLMVLMCNASSSYSHGPSCTPDLNLVVVPMALGMMMLACSAGCICHGTIRVLIDISKWEKRFNDIKKHDKVDEPIADLEKQGEKRAGHYMTYSQILLFTGAGMMFAGPILAGIKCLL